MRAIVGFVSLGLLASIGFGSDAALARSSRVSKACEADARRLCPREKKDGPELEYCMEAKGKMLSNRCQRALEDDGIIPRGYFKK